MYRSLPKPLLGALRMHKRQVCRFVLSSALLTCEKHKAICLTKGFVAVPDENTASMKLQAEENQDAICKNVLYERESMD